jgi:hypothetical protein
MANLVILDGNLAAQNVSSLADSDGSYTLIRTSEHRKPTFRYAGVFTPVATPTDVMIIQGSATKTGRVKRIALWGIATTAGAMPITLVRRSAADSGGTGVATAINPGKLDTSDAAATCVVSTVGTGNFTSLGTSANNVGQGMLWFALLAGAPTAMVFEFATRQDKALILRGTSDFVCINLAGAALPATTPSIYYEIQLEEDVS